MNTIKRMYMMLVVALTVAVVGIAGPALAGLGTSPSLSLSTSTIMWRWVEPITLYAGLGTSPSKTGDGGRIPKRGDEKLEDFRTWNSMDILRFPVV